METLKKLERAAKMLGDLELEYQDSIQEILEQEIKRELATIEKNLLGSLKGIKTLEGLAEFEKELKTLRRIQKKYDGEEYAE